MAPLSKGIRRFFRVMQKCFLSKVYLIVESFINFEVLFSVPAYMLGSVPNVFLASSGNEREFARRDHSLNEIPPQWLHAYIFNYLTGCRGL